MNFFKIMSCLLILTSLAACSSITFPLQGTDVAVVTIALDENKVPKVAQERVEITTEQRVVWVGPKGFSLRFTDGSPFKAAEDSGIRTKEDTVQEDTIVYTAKENTTKEDVIVYKAEGFTINLEVPKESQRLIPEQQDRIVFKYDVIVGDQVLDPHIILIRK